MNLEGLTEKHNQKGTVYFVSTDGNIVAKGCSKCLKVKEITEFTRNKKMTCGRHSECKACKKSYRALNKERASEISKKWYEENKDHAKKYRNKYYKENKEVLLEKSRVYKEQHKEERRAYSRDYRENHLIRQRETTRNWQKSNPDKMKLYFSRRRARQANLPDTLTDKEYAKTLANFGNACALTGETENLEKEHTIPISVGHGGTTFENCYPMVNGLNQSKGNKNIFEWFEANRQRFNLSQERFDRLIEWLGKANGMTVEEYRDYVYWCHDNPRDVNEDSEQQAM